MYSKIKRVLCTIKYLKPSQLKWQLFTRLKRKSVINETQCCFDICNIISFREYIPINSKYFGNGKFVFLNLEKSFGTSINWNFLDYGKLWNYNLEYFDYLNQEEISLEDKDYLINEFYGFSLLKRRILEPYPVSLRSINIMKYVLREKIKERKYLSYLYQELEYLHDNYEFHILGNHLLENAFALFLGGIFFKQLKWHQYAKKILFKQLDEQILSDGAHFELSPMYHQIIFFRLLELIDWYETFEARDNEFYKFCTERASRMRSWLEQISFNNGDIPLFNDAANGISLPNTYLFSYAEKLNIKSANLPLGDSGYRSYKASNFEIKIDLAQIGASYQPGHAHADALSFVVYYKGAPLFVEQGTSTYQIGKRRDIERSTLAHNTVTIEDINQSNVWGGFRVGNRARVTIHNETKSTFKASHDGYKEFGIVHTRNFILDGQEIQLVDKLSENANAKFHLHLHPDKTFLKIDEYRFKVIGCFSLCFYGATDIFLEEYEYADTYNQYKKGQKLIVSFDKELISKIQFEQ